MKSGFVYALLAYLSWGIFPLYWKSIQSIPADEVLAHRIIWSTFFVTFLIILFGNHKLFLKSLAAKKNWLIYSASGALIAFNWYIYIWAVSAGFILETSLGYFINPLLNVLFGYVILKEKLRPKQWMAVALVAIGVLYLTIGYGKVPVIALLLAVSFGLYGILKKFAPLDALHGLAIETYVLLPASLIYLFFMVPEPHFYQASVSSRFLLVASGVATALPLFWFAKGAKLLSLSTLGFIQYIAPTCQFLLAIFLYKEEFTSVHLVTFGCIWLGITLYLLDLYLHAAKNKSKNTLITP